MECVFILSKTNIYKLGQKNVYVVQANAVFKFKFFISLFYCKALLHTLIDTLFSSKKASVNKMSISSWAWQNNSLWQKLTSCLVQNVILSEWEEK